MTAVTLQWVVLGLCIVGAAVRVPAARRGGGRVIFVALVLLSVCVGLSIAPIYEMVDGVFGGINLANLLLRLALYAVFLLFAVRMAAAFGSPLARRLVVGPFGLAVLGVTVAATLYFFVASELPGSSAGLRAFDDQDSVQQYAAVGRLYPGYVAACLVVPAAASALDRQARVIHRVACGLLAGGFFLVVGFVALRLTPLDLSVWDIILPFSAILLTVVGLCLIWASHIVNGRSRRRANKLA